MDKENKNEVGTRVKQLRKSLGLTQTSFAELIGITQATVVMYENGTRSVSTRSVLTICRAFGVSFEWLQNGHGDMLTEPTLEDEISMWSSALTRTGSDFKKKFTVMLSRLDESDWATLEKMIDIMRDLK